MLWLDQKRVFAMVYYRLKSSLFIDLYLFIYVQIVHMPLCTFVMLKYWSYIMFWWKNTSRHLTLRQLECILAGNDVRSPLTTGSQISNPYGHHECYLVDEIVSNILKKAYDRKFDKEWMQFIDLKDIICGLVRKFVCSPLSLGH